MLPNYENEEQIARKLFYNIHKQFFEKSLISPKISLHLTKYRKLTWHIYTVYTFKSSLAKLAQSLPYVLQAGMASNLGLAHNIEFILWQN